MRSSGTPSLPPCAPARSERLLGCFGGGGVGVGVGVGVGDVVMFIGGVSATVKKRGKKETFWSHFAFGFGFWNLGSRQSTAPGRRCRGWTPSSPGPSCRAMMRQLLRHCFDIVSNRVFLSFPRCGSSALIPPRRRPVTCSAESCGARTWMLTGACDRMLY